jgi:hypothetical protein
MKRGKGSRNDRCLALGIALYSLTIFAIATKEEGS